MEKYHEIPQPQEIHPKEKERSFASYMMMFFSNMIGLPLPIINLLASLGFYQYTKKTSRFTHFHTLQSLLSQIPISILNLGAFIWFIVNLVNSDGFADSDFKFNNYWLSFIIFVVVCNLIYFIISLIAGIQAYRGRMYYFLFFGKIAYHHAFKDTGIDDQQTQTRVINKAPKL